MFIRLDSVDLQEIGLFWLNVVDCMDLTRNEGICMDLMVCDDLLMIVWK